MESLEEMLAALEGPSTGENYGNELDSISNIDEFLDQIEEEARMSTKSRQPTSAGFDDFDFQQGGGARVQVQPQRQPAPSVNQLQRQQPPITHQPQRQEAPVRQQQAAQPARQVAPSNAQPMRQAAPSRGGGGGGSSAAAMAELESKGHERHNNQGKWINYSGGKASDFRIKGTTSSRVGLSHTITLRALDDNANPAKVDNPRDFIGVILTHVQSSSNLQCYYRDNGNGEYDLSFCPERPGSIRMEIKLAGNPMFDIEIQVEDIGSSLWAAKPRLPAKPKEMFVIDIETVDGSRPEGVAPFEVQTVGSVENLRLVNNGDGTYRFQCIPQAHGHITIQLTLHGQPIKNSPVTVQVGDKPQMKIRQESSHVETISDTRPPRQIQDEDEYGGGNGYEEQDNNQYGGAGFQNPRDSADVSNEDLNRLLDELGG